MGSERKRSILRFIWVLPIALLTVSGIAKTLGVDFLVQRMQENGMGHMTRAVGVVTLICVATFLVSRTRNIGFLLCVAFAGGILATEWACNRPVVPGLMIQTLLWIGMYFESPNHFKLSRGNVDLVSE